MVTSKPSVSIFAPPSRTLAVVIFLEEGGAARLCLQGAAVEIKRASDPQGAVAAVDAVRRERAPVQA